MTLIGVKSKYGSCSRNCTGLINVNNNPFPRKKKQIQKRLGASFYVGNNEILMKHVTNPDSNAMALDFS